MCFDFKLTMTPICPCCPACCLLLPHNNLLTPCRRKLACILIEDPDHRLRVAHLEPLLQAALGPQQLPCSSGRLQALLTDPSTAKIFPVDFSAQVPDWRSRVVFLDVSQLSAGISAAKHHRQQQQQHADATGADQDHVSRLQRGSSSGCSESAALDSHLMVSDSANNAADGPQQQQRAPSSQGSQRPAPLALETIFGNSPAFGGGPVGRASSSAGGGMQAQAQHSSSMPAPDSAGTGAQGGQQAGMSSSLFGGSFEVPHAIASCWADNQGGYGHSHPSAKHQALDVLGAADGGSSSMASGSSTRSFAGPAASAGAAVPLPARPATGSSRLRNASSMQAGEGTSTEPAAANSIDVCTPRSGIAAPGGVDRSPLHSADIEEDTEYSEAALVFGSVNAATGSAALAAAASTGEDALPAGSMNEERAGSGAVEGPGLEGAGQLEQEGSFSMQGVDWSHVADLHQQQQQAEAAYHYQQQQQAQQQQALLFGLDGFGGDSLTPRGSSGGAAAAEAAARARGSALAAAATGALTARRLLMEHAGVWSCFWLLTFGCQWVVVM